jgi:hypothetical protein
MSFCFMVTIFIALTAFNAIMFIPLPAVSAVTVLTAITFCRIEATFAAKCCSCILTGFTRLYIVETLLTLFAEVFIIVRIFDT